MPRDRWLEKYTILEAENGDYFGEFVLDENGERLPYGTGVFYYNENKTYIMQEDYNLEEKNTGMYFREYERGAYDPVSGYAMPRFAAGIMKNGVPFGDTLYITPGSGKSLEVEYAYRELTRPIGHTITVYHDGSYVIEEVRDGLKTGRLYRYRYGRLTLEATDASGKRTTYKVIACGRDFEIRKTSMLPPYYFGNGMTTGFRPAIATRVRDGKDEYFEYRGAVQTIGEKQEYLDLTNGDRIFTNPIRDFAIIPQKSGDKFFGQVTEEGKGGYSITGFGCVKHILGPKYIGQLVKGKKSGLGLLMTEDVAYLGAFHTGQLYGGGFELYSTIYISSFKSGKKQPHHYGIDQNFNLTEYDGENVLDYVIFDEVMNKTPHGVDDEVPNEEKINLNQREMLNARGLTYEIDDEGDIYLTGVTKNALATFQELHIPGFVKGIRRGAFRGMSKLRLVEAEEGFQIIEAEAFYDCPSIKELSMPRTLKVIGEDAFTTKKLEKLDVLAGCDRLATRSFRACTGLKKVFIPTRCVVENEALPPKFDDINGQNFDKRKIEKAKKRKEKFEKNKEKLNQKIDRKIAKERRRKKSFNALPAIGKFFAAIGSALLAALLFIPRAVWGFLTGGFDFLKDFFTYTLPDAFTSSLRGLGYFFRRLGEGIAFIFTAPFKLLFRFFGSFTSSTSAIVGLVGILLCGVTMALGCTGCLYYISEGTSYFMSNIVPSMFGFRLLMGSVELFDSIETSPLVLLIALLVILGLIADLILNLLAAIVALILGILYFLFGVIFIWGGGAVIAIPSLVSIILASKEGDDKGVPTLSLIIGIVCCVIYYLFMEVFYGPV